ncbi:unnamed protein product, partial [Nesidiocoris tenuis]
MFRPVRTLGTLELWLFTTFVLHMARQMTFVYVCATTLAFEPMIRGSRTSARNL